MDRPNRRRRRTPTSGRRTWTIPPARSNSPTRRNSNSPTRSLSKAGSIRCLPTNATYCGTEQIFFRGYPEPLDCGGLGDPYWLALEPSPDPTRYDLHFHIADAQTGTLGADVLTTNSPVQLGGGSNGGWWHIAAVFDKPFTNITVVSNGTNVVTITTNALRLYLNGVCVATNYTTLSPYQDLDPARSPGVTIGNRSGYDWTQPFYGFMDELTVYARALTGPEIAAIAAAGSNGKADLSVPPGPEPGGTERIRGRRVPWHRLRG